MKQINTKTTRPTKENSTLYRWFVKMRNKQLKKLCNKCMKLMCANCIAVSLVFDPKNFKDTENMEESLTRLSDLCNPCFVMMCLNCQLNIISRYHSQFH